MKNETIPRLFSLTVLEMHVLVVAESETCAHEGEVPSELLSVTADFWGFCLVLGSLCRPVLSPNCLCFSPSQNAILYYFLCQLNIAK